MEIDFKKLNQEQINIIISRLCNKITNLSTVNINEFSDFLLFYRYKRFETGVINLLEGDEILKGILYKKSSTKKKEVTKDNLKTSNTDDNKEQHQLDESKNSGKEEIENISLDETQEFEREEFNTGFSSFSKFRKKAFLNDDSRDGARKNNIILDDNIEQIESKFSLREINSQLPAENLLDRYNFGYIDLSDEDSGLSDEEILGKKIRKNLLKIKK